MSDAIRDALAEVEGGDDDPDDVLGGPTETAVGEEPDARPEGPLPGADLDGLEDESAGFDLVEWAQSVPEGSHRDFDASDWWDPEHGAENRLAFHLSDATDSSNVGYPNAVGVVVGFAELYWTRLRDTADDGDDAGAEADAPDAETVDADTAEALV